MNKVMILKSLTCILFIILSFNTAYSAIEKGLLKANSTIINKPQDKSEQATHRIVTDDQEYKLLYENEKIANDKILQTVYWSLGGMLTTVIGVVAFILGAQIFFNYRINKEEINKLESGIKAQIDSLSNNVNLSMMQNFEEFKQITHEAVKKDIDDLTTTYEERLKSYSDFVDSRFKSFEETSIERLNNFKSSMEKFNELTQTIHDSMKEDANKLLKTYEERFKSYSDFVDSRFQSFEKTSNERLSNLKSSIALNNKKTADEIEALSNKLDTDIKVLEIKANINEADGWLVKEVPQNAISCYVSALEAVVGLPPAWDFYITHLFKDIKSVLEKETFISDSNKENFIEVFKKIPSKFNSEKHNILTILNSKKIVKLRP